MPLRAHLKYPPTHMEAARLSTSLSSLAQTLQRSQKFVKFIQTRYADPRLKAILMICTGSMCLARTRILDGHQVCSNKFVLRMAANGKTLYNKIKWIGDRRWVIELWSVGGVTCGIDLAAEYARQHFNPEIVRAAIHCINTHADHFNLRRL
ncbi:hypothetical protein JR316_0008466 [Psilocybe cubensis]|uniref:Uncharacterized protein n=1 Tax=Psilocybe cubensis TaxID=181762 RepID=A0ACB8GY34_PSICU|nr:hypothetical protein JR316_0008466 [Psilocybe cubensis]KAH9479870.1 hypothetical protein JR316_0008466 [Psilocybe cubensis]